MTLRLTDSQIKQILKVKSTFQMVERISGVPWQMTAAVWYRESFSVAPPTTPGGPFQFDPPPTQTAMESLMRNYTNLQPSEIVRHAKNGINNFTTGAILCACWLRTKTTAVLNTKSSEGVIKDALWGYNGRYFGSPNNSAYVMNGFDDQHMGMRIKGTIPDGKGGRRKINTIDGRPGTFTVYKQLKALD